MGIITLHEYCHEQESGASGSGSGLPLDSGRQLSATRPISSRDMERPGGFNTPHCFFSRDAHLYYGDEPGGGSGLPYDLQTLNYAKIAAVSFYIASFFMGLGSSVLSGSSAGPKS